MAFSVKRLVKRRTPAQSPAGREAGSAAAPQRPTNPNFTQLERDAAARRGGFQNFDSRRAAQGLGGNVQRQSRALPPPR